MSSSGTNLFATKVLLLSQRLVSHLRTILRSQDDGEEGEQLIVGERSTPQSLHRPSLPLQLEASGSPAPDLDNLPLSQHYAQMVQEPLSSLPSSCRLLGPEDFKLVGEHPIAAGRFANVWVGTYQGRKVVLKSYRCYMSSDVAQLITVRCNHCFYRTQY